MLINIEPSRLKSLAAPSYICLKTCVMKMKDALVTRVKKISLLDSNILFPPSPFLLSVFFPPSYFHLLSIPHGHQSPG